MYRGVEVVSFAKVNGQVMLEVVAVLFCLVVGKGILPGVICVVTETAVDDVLTNAFGETTRFVPGVVVGNIFSIFETFDDESLLGCADSDR